MTAISARDRAGTARASRLSTVVPRLPQSSSTGRSTLTRYQPSGIDAARARNASRSWRRSRLRTTAEPMRRGVENATRTVPAAGSGTARSARPPSRTARTVRNRSKPSRRGMRPITPTDGRDPWRVATSRRRDHLWSSSACETRVSWHDDACWAGMFVSRLSPDVTYKAIGSNVLKARGVRRASQRVANPDGVISPLCALWKTCYVASPAAGDRARHTTHRITSGGFSTSCGSPCGRRTKRDIHDRHEHQRHDERHRFEQHHHDRHRHTWRRARFALATRRGRLAPAGVRSSLVLHLQRHQRRA